VWGCGNFLVIAYQELRLLKFAVIKEIGGQIHVGVCKVNVDQFCGIEIDEWTAQIIVVQHLTLLCNIQSRKYMY
jgi:hypothetical protein